MYLVSREDKVKESNIELLPLDGFLMTKRGLKVNNKVVKNIKIIDKDLASILTYEKVSYKYNKLIKLLTELITSDDSTGEAQRIALDEIEKFRLEIKNKYRKYLKKKQLEKMSKELTVLRKQAVLELENININLKNLQNTNKRGR